jgi:hypothetical protein
MKTKTYKAIMLPEELHYEIKNSASRKSQSIIQYISFLVAKEKITNGKRV